MTEEGSDTGRKEREREGDIFHLLLAAMVKGWVRLKLGAENSI